MANPNPPGNMIGTQLEALRNVNAEVIADTTAVITSLHQLPVNYYSGHVEIAPAKLVTHDIMHNTMPATLHITLQQFQKRWRDLSFASGTKNS